MKYLVASTLLIVVSLCSFRAGLMSTESNLASSTLLTQKIKSNMKLGAFSISLGVKDLAASKRFYEQLGFKVLAGSNEVNYFIMKNEETLIGIFYGMFQGNILTFNPGWDQAGQNTDIYDDVRVIQNQLKAAGIKLDSEIDESSSGPASIMLKDPDGNIILVDQHR